MSSRSSSSKEASKSKSSSSSNSKSKSKTADEIRQKEREEYITSLLTHTGYLAASITALSSGLEVDSVHTAIALGVVYLVLLLLTPAFLLPHFGALVTLIIPVRNSLNCVAGEQQRAKEPSEGAHWCYYWVVWATLGGVGGWVDVWRPGWKAMYEVGRVCCLVTVGGPWFSRAGLRPPGPSDVLKEAEKVEAEREKKTAAEEEKNKAKKDKEKEKSSEKDKKDKETDKAREKKEKDRERAKKEKDQGKAKEK